MSILFKNRAIASAMRNPQAMIRNQQYKGKVKAVIFDWAGTTVDAHVIAPAQAFRDVFARYKVPITIEEAREPMGKRKDEHIAEIIEMPQVRETWIESRGEDPIDIKTNKARKDIVEKMYREFKPIQLRSLPNYAKPIDGVPELMKFLNKLRIKVGTTTGYNERMMNTILERTAFNGYNPHSNVAGDTVPNNMGFRPAPFMIYQNMLNLGVFPIQSVIKIDDTNTGITAGHNAGCWTVGVRATSNYTNVSSLDEWNSFSSLEQQKRIEKADEKLQEAGPHYIIDTVVDMPIVIQDINDRLKNGEKP